MRHIRSWSLCVASEFQFELKREEAPASEDSAGDRVEIAEAIAK